VRVAVLVASVLSLLSVASAGAAGPSQALVCGRSLEAAGDNACGVTTDKRFVLRLLDRSLGVKPLAAPRPAPFYRVRFLSATGKRWKLSYLYVPSRAMIRMTTAGGVYWGKAPKAVVAAFESVITLRLRPFAVPRRWPA
jgi:hypothetical protein